MSTKNELNATTHMYSALNVSVSLLASFLLARLQENCFLGIKPVRLHDCLTLPSVLLGGVGGSKKEYASISNSLFQRMLSGQVGWPRFLTHTITISSGLSGVHHHHRFRRFLERRQLIFHALASLDRRDHIIVLKIYH